MFGRGNINPRLPNAGPQRCRAAKCARGYFRVSVLVRRLRRESSAWLTRTAGGQLLSGGESGTLVPLRTRPTWSPLEDAILGTRKKQSTCPFCCPMHRMSPTWPSSRGATPAKGFQEQYNTTTATAGLLLLPRGVPPTPAPADFTQHLSQGRGGWRVLTELYQRPQGVPDHQVCPIMGWGWGAGRGTLRHFALLAHPLLTSHCSSNPLAHSPVTKHWEWGVAGASVPRRSVSRTRRNSDEGHRILPVDPPRPQPYRPHSLQHLLPNS